MRKCLQMLLLTLLSACLPTAARAEWKPVEKVEAYAISGRTGPELYASIGEKGPKIGMVRVIAYTDFKLTWTRDYQPRDGSCTLASAKPKLTITYRLPKPSGKLSEASRPLWEKFSAGVRAHEKVHGEIIVELVEAIEAESIGLTVADDPKCQKIRKQLTKRLAVLSATQRARSRDFDRDEFGDGGKVHRLILALVNGG